MGRKVPVIGLCGGIGAGKSAVAAEFARLGCVVIDSDKQNHEVLRRSDVRRTLAEWWGPDVLHEDGTVNRSRIADIVFSSNAEKRRLESLVYPLIARDRDAIIMRSKLDPAVKAIILDSPLLFESNLDRICDEVIFVEAPEQLRLARLEQTRGWPPTEAQRRQQQQAPLDQKRERSGFVVRNEGEITELGRQVAEILEKILA